MRGGADAGGAREGMRWVPGGEFTMGAAGVYPEEGPARRVTVEGFWMDEHPVTNEQFARFVRETGHVTVAELAPDPAAYPGVDPAALVPGSLVFRKPARRVGLGDHLAWWAYVPGACWRRPEGPTSSLEGRERHPVVHVAYEDGAAYAAWAGKSLPTEAQWEYAARGGIDGARFVWGDEQTPGGGWMANTWQGEFPWENLGSDGYEGTSPVGAFPANGYGLLDMAGNVWEWTADVYEARRGGGDGGEKKACCPGGDGPGGGIVQRVVKGGSHLCAPNYCMRYRPAARQGEAVDTSACHLGFRCVARSGGKDDIAG